MTFDELSKYVRECVNDQAKIDDYTLRLYLMGVAAGFWAYHLFSKN